MNNKQGVKMRKKGAVITLSAVLIFTVSLIAKSTMVSGLPTSNNMFIDLDIEKCGDNCLKEHLDKGFIFSFMAKYKDDTKSNELRETYYELQALFKVKSDVSKFADEDIYMDSTSGTGRRIALIIPQKKIGKYALTTTNSILAYLLLGKGNFEFEVFNTENESEQRILDALDEIREKGYSFVIAPMTKTGARIIIENSENLVVYIPTLNKNFLGSEYSNIYYGGVDYSKQIQALLPYSKSSISIFKTKGELSQNLTRKVRFNFPNISYEKEIDKNLREVKYAIRRARRMIQGQTLFLNTPIVKSSLILSQLQANSVKPYSILSTQINYNPILLTLTQYGDRKNFLIANSIGNSDVKLIELNKMLNSDIKYNWINYSTSIGVDFLSNKFYKTQKMFSEEMLDNQLNYNISIMQPLSAKFRVIPSMSE